MEDFAARLRIGEVLRGERLEARVQAGLLFREFDHIKKEYYYWEEWELSHPSFSDCWIEYDHDSKQIALYEPITLPDPPDPRTLTESQHISLRLPDGSTRAAYVSESGFGELVGVKGRPSCHASRGDRIAYATLKFIDKGGIWKVVNIEIYGEKDYSIHTKHVLSHEEHVSSFGKRVSPVEFPPAIKALFFVAIMFLILVFIAVIISNYNGNSDGDDGDVYYHRRSVYGGGGGGIGK